MKNSVINSNREKHHIYDQNGDCVHRVKKSILHPPFSESQPEKAEKGTFFVGSIRILFLTKNTTFRKVREKNRKKECVIPRKKEQKTHFFFRKKEVFEVISSKILQIGLRWK